MKLKKWFNIKINALVILFCGVMLGFGLSQNSDGLWLFSTGDAVSSSKMNENFQMLLNRIKVLEQAVPQNTVAAFNLTICPPTWSAADGTSGKPDLRGMFLRGLNNFGTGARSDGKQDPDIRNITDFQWDGFKRHNHNANANPGEVGLIRKSIVGERNTTDTVDTGGSGVEPDLGRVYPISNSGIIETRPKNVALIFCVKN